MRVFLTSATGHVGHGVAEAFLAAGHDVTALARSPERAEALDSRGIRPIQGDLSHPSTYVDAAAEHGIILHTAFEYDSEGAEKTSTDKIAVEALLRAAQSRSEETQVIYTSSAFLLADIKPQRMDETTATTGAHPDTIWRLDQEQRVLTAASASLRTAVIRLGVVYGGNSLSMNELFSCAEREGAVAYYADGRNRWPFVHLHDAAALYLAVAEKKATGIFHAVDGEPLPMSRVAEIASRTAGCGGAVRSISIPQARQEIGAHVDRVARDVPVVATRSRQLGWSPRFRSFEKGAEAAYRDWSLGREGASR